MVIGRPVDDDVLDGLWVVMGADVYYLLTQIGEQTGRRLRAVASDDDPSVAGRHADLSPPRLQRAGGAHEPGPEVFASRGGRRRDRAAGLGRDLRRHTDRRVEPRVPLRTMAGPRRGLVPGARFRGRNRAGWARWSRTCEIVTADPPRQIVWRTVPTLLFPDSTQWRIRLEPTRDGRTLITQSFTVLRAPWLLDRLYARLIPAHQDRDARLAEDLARVGAAARRGAET